MLVAILKLLGSLFQSQGPTYGKLYILDFNLQKGNLDSLLQ